MKLLCQLLIFLSWFSIGDLVHWESCGTFLLLECLANLRLWHHLKWLLGKFTESLSSLVPMPAWVSNWVLSLEHVDYGHAVRLGEYSLLHWSWGWGEADHLAAALANLVDCHDEDYWDEDASYYDEDEGHCWPFGSVVKFGMLQILIRLDLCVFLVS